MDPKDQQMIRNALVASSHLAKQARDCSRQVSTSLDYQRSVRPPNTDDALLVGAIGILNTAASSATQAAETLLTVVEIHAKMLGSIPQDADVQNEELGSGENPT